MENDCYQRSELLPPITKTNASKDQDQWYTQSPLKYRKTSMTYMGHSTKCTWLVSPPTRQESARKTVVRWEAEAKRGNISINPFLFRKSIWFPSLFRKKKSRQFHASPSVASSSKIRNSCGPFLLGISWGEGWNKHQSFFNSKMLIPLALIGFRQSKWKAAQAGGSHRFTSSISKSRTPTSRKTFL